jgi:hypothetical protein
MTPFCRQRQLQRLIIQRNTVPSQQMKFRVRRRRIYPAIWFEDFEKVTEKARGFVGVALC